MIYLFLSILCSVAVANLLKLFSKKEPVSGLYIFLGNYLVASVIGWLFTINSEFSIHPSDILISGVSGLFFLMGFIYYLKNISKNGLSISVSTFRMSLIIPISGSMVIFHEFLSIVNYLGIILIVLSFLLLGSEKKKYDLLLLTILFFIAGFADFFPKIYKHYGNHNPDSVFLMLNFIFAFFFNILFIILKRTKFSTLSFFFGLLLGIPNFFTAFFLMKAFNTVAGTMAYPVLSSSIVILTMATDYFIWKKRFTKKEYLIYSMILTGIILTVVSL